MTSHWRCANGHTYTSPAPQTVCAYGRCGAPALRAKVLGVDKPKPVPEGQLDMFGDAA